jgi:2-oxo-4-hydroxy-4-carboxy-5-ureidoimidazoline decarboxylase
MSPVTANPAAATPVTFMLTLSQLNRFSQAEFTQALGAVFEHSPWIANRAWAARPFESVNILHAAMVQVLNNASEQEKLALICAHPELAGKEAKAGTLTSESKSEQRGAGLDQCTAQELESLRNLNKRYREKFGFPFVVAVKGLTRNDILSAIAQRLENEKQEEFGRCLHEITKIALFRLQAQVSETP